MRADNKSGHFGVYQSGVKWIAKAWALSKNIYLGTYNTKEEAIDARVKYERDNNYHVNHGNIKRYL